MEKEIKKAIKEYNKYRSPRLSAELLDFSEEEIKVKFEGTFCRTCGMEDYFEDLVYELRKEGIDTEFITFKEDKFQEFIARYRIKEGQ